MGRRKRYSAEFKRQALRRANEPGVTDALVAEELSAAPAGNAVGGPTVQILDRADQVDALAEAVAAHGSSRAPEEAETEAEPGPGANRPFAPPRAERSRRDA